MRTPLALILLAGILFLGVWTRLEHRAFFAEEPDFWGVTAYHLATSHAIGEGRWFETDQAERDAAGAFLHETPGGFTRSLGEFDAAVDSLRAAGRTETRFYSGDQTGWGALVALARRLPGVDTLAGVSGLQIVLDLGALLLLFPIGRRVFGSDGFALAGCLLYAVYPPIGMAAAEPFRDAWPGFAAVYGTALLLPAWKAGPSRLWSVAGWLVAAGVVAGLATYVRTTAATVPAALGILTWIAWRQWRPAALAAAVVGAAMILTLAPWSAATLRHAGVYALTSSGNGHSFLTGLGEEDKNPIGLSFDDAFVSGYVRDVCGYEVEYATFPYSAACTREARRFIREDPGWYASLVGLRVARRYLVREVTPRLKWGKARDWLPKDGRARIERWMPLAGLTGCVLGLLRFRGAWIPLVWILHFMAFILPFQSHPRLTLGAEWALLLGLVFWVAAPARFALRRARAPGPDWAPARLARREWVLGGAALAVCLVSAVLLQVRAPRAPEPRLDWRAGLASDHPGERLATLEAVRGQVRNALPVLTAAREHSDPAVRAKAAEVRDAFREPVAILEFDDGPGFEPFPGVTATTIRDPGARDGHALRLVAPREPRRILLALSWPVRPDPGIYQVGLHARLEAPLMFAFLGNDDPEAVRQWEYLTESGYPMKEFLYVDFEVKAPPGDSTLTALIMLHERVPTGGGPATQDFDRIEVWFERSVAAP